MKRSIILLLFLVSIAASGRDKKDVLAKIQQVYREQAAWADAGELSYDEATGTIAVKSFRIPVSENTGVSVDKKSKKVTFMLQKNTAVTDVSDASFKRAYWELEFKTKDACASFAKYFRQLSKS